MKYIDNNNKNVNIYISFKGSNYLPDRDETINFDYQSSDYSIRFYPDNSWIGQTASSGILKVKVHKQVDSIEFKWCNILFQKSGAKNIFVSGHTKMKIK